MMVALGHGSRTISPQDKTPRTKSSRSNINRILKKSFTRDIIRGDIVRGGGGGGLSWGDIVRGDIVLISVIKPLSRNIPKMVRKNRKEGKVTRSAVPGTGTALKNSFA